MTFATVDKQQVRQNFSEHAGEYDLYARVQKRVAGRLLELALSEAIVGPVLDIGTGTGEVSRRLVRKCPELPMVVSDIAHDMTITARQHLPFSLAVDADAQALPFKDDSFGLVLSSSVFQWVEDLAAAFAECRRILKPGGRMVFAMFSHGTLEELATVFRRSLNSCDSDWPFHFQVFPELFEVETAMADAGFTDSHCHVETEKEYHATFRDLMAGLKRIGAQNASCRRPAGLFPRQVMQEMSRLYNLEYLTDEGLSASYGVLYGIARKK